MRMPSCEAGLVEHASAALLSVRLRASLQLTKIFDYFSSLKSNTYVSYYVTVLLWGPKEVPKKTRMRVNSLALRLARTARAIFVSRTAEVTSMYCIDGAARGI